MDVGGIRPKGGPGMSSEEVVTKIDGIGTDHREMAQIRKGITTKNGYDGLYEMPNEEEAGMFNNSKCSHIVYQRR